MRLVLDYFVVGIKGSSSGISIKQRKLQKSDAVRDKTLAFYQLEQFVSTNLDYLGCQ